MSDQNYVVTKSGNISILEILLVSLTCTFLAWYAQFYYSRRRLYYLTSKIKDGPPAFPIIGSAHLFVGSTYHSFLAIKKIFDIYGTLFKVWFGKYVFFCVSNPKHLEIICNHPKALAKEFVYEYAVPTVGYGIFTAPVEKWKKHRKIIMPTFNQKILDSFVPIFAERNLVLLDQIKKVVGKSDVDLLMLIGRATVDLIAETAMGIKIDAQITKCEFTHWLDRLMVITFLRMSVIFYQIDLVFYLSPHRREQDILTKKMFDFTTKILKEKKREHEKRQEEMRQHPEAQIHEEPKRKAFLDYLLERANDTGMTDEEIRQEVVTFMIGGSDTTATNLCFLMPMLGMHQDIQQKVYEEVMEVLGPDRLIEPADMPRLQYLERVLKENLRLFPSVSFVARHFDDEIDVGDYILPKGGSAFLGIFSVHRNPEYWPDPLKFDPDRFLSEEIAKRHPYAYMPFSAGPRNCVGPRYALMSMKAMVSSIIRKYKIFTGYKRVDEIEIQSNVMIRPRDGWKIRFELRSQD